MTEFDMKNVRLTTTITIPDFTGETYMEVEVKKPQMLKMLEKIDEVPNPLRGGIYEIINGVDFSEKVDGQAEAERMARMMHAYAYTCLVSPTYDEIKDIITDQQLAYIYAWVARGPKKLASFRDEQKDNSDNPPSEALQKKTK